MSACNVFPARSDTDQTVAMALCEKCSAPPF